VKVGERRRDGAWSERTGYRKKGLRRGPTQDYIAFVGVNPICIYTKLHAYRLQIICTQKGWVLT